MDRREFKKKIEQELSKYDDEQVLLFSWRCAVRALPFLASDGTFNFWNEQARQEHIFSVLYALDLKAADAYTLVADYQAAYEAADAAYEAANDAEDTYNDADYDYFDVDNAYEAANDSDAAKAVFAAVNAANAANAAAYAANDSAENIAANANIYADAADAAYAVVHLASQNNMKLEPIIFQDLYSIQNRMGETKGDPTDFYGEIWENFQKALEAVGCAYWGQLYKSIFDVGLVLDLDALKRRINVPNEIRQQGATSVAIFLEELAKGAKQFNEARIIILGDKGAGKTCIARRLIDPEAAMTTDAESTAGVNTMLWKLEHENINVGIWDFAGHTVTHAVHQFFLSERCLYLMVYDGRTEERNRLEYWLDHMKNYGGDSKSMILVNQRDQHSVDIPINFLKEKYPILNVYHFSIKDDAEGLAAFRNDVAGHIKNNPSWENQQIPSSYYHVKEELGRLFAKDEKGKGREHISKDEFYEIAERYEVDNKEELLKSLHFLGVSLWYEDIEAIDTLVLNPEWISHGVYKIINWVNEAKKILFNIS